MAKTKKKRQYDLAEEVKEQQEYLMAKSHTDYSAYVELVNEGWIKGRHLAYICETVQGFLYGDAHTPLGQARLLVLSVPPQFGKSMCITETLPSYFLGQNPSSRTILLSYGEDLALKFGRRNKEKVALWGEALWGIKLSKHKKSDAVFELEGRTGSIISRGIMSGVTGNPADLILIDDPIKNREQANSDTYREKLWEEFNNSIYTRLSARGKIILIMTRWHEDDLAGRLINSGILPTVVINIPCEAEADDPLGREVGEPLFPEIGKGKEWLEQTKQMYLSGKNSDAREMGSGVRAWNALYQGRPTAEKGNLISKDWWRFYDSVPNTFDDAVISVDCAFKDEDSSDFVVIQGWGKLGIDFYLIDQRRGRMSFTETLNEIRKFCRIYPQFRTILVEDKANGTAVIDVLQKEIIGIVPVNPVGSKVSRVNAITPAIESGHVYLPKYTGWVEEFIEECASFPKGANDDMVDSMSQAMNRLYFVSGRIRRIQPKKDGFYTPKEREAFEARENPHGIGFKRPNKIREGNNRAKRFNSRSR